MTPSALSYQLRDTIEGDFGEPKLGVNREMRRRFPPMFSSKNLRQDSSHRHATHVRSGSKHFAVPVCRLQLTRREVQTGGQRPPAGVPASARRSPPWQPRPWRGVVAGCSRSSCRPGPQLPGISPRWTAQPPTPMSGLESRPCSPNCRRMVRVPRSRWGRQRGRVSSGRGAAGRAVARNRDAAIPDSIQISSISHSSPSTVAKGLLIFNFYVLSEEAFEGRITTNIGGAANAF
jgi:hypothetical protein